MDKIIEYLEKIIKKANDKGAYYSFGVEHRSTQDQPLYIVTVVWTKAGLTPLRLVENSKKDLVDQLKKYHRTKKKNDLNIRYHENQIKANENVIKHHKEMIDSYKYPKKKAKKAKNESTPS